MCIFVHHFSDYIRGAIFIFLPSIISFLVLLDRICIVVMLVNVYVSFYNGNVKWRSPFFCCWSSVQYSCNFIWIKELQRYWTKPTNWYTMNMLRYLQTVYITVKMSDYALYLTVLFCQMRKYVMDLGTSLHGLSRCIWLPILSRTCYLYLYTRMKAREILTHFILSVIIVL